MQNVKENYDRNESKPANDDIAEKEFALTENEIRLKYHYGASNVTANRREFIKPNVAEMGEDLTFNPNFTTGYLAEVGAKPPKQLQLFYLLQQLLEDEEKVLYHLREIEDEVCIYIFIFWFHEKYYNI